MARHGTPLSFTALHQWNFMPLHGTFEPPHSWSIMDPQDARLFKPLALTTVVPGKCITSWYLTVLHHSPIARHGTPLAFGTLHLTLQNPHETPWHVMNRFFAWRYLIKHTISVVLPDVTSLNLLLYQVNISTSWNLPQSRATYLGVWTRIRSQLFSTAVSLYIAWIPGVLKHKMRYFLMTTSSIRQPGLRLCLDAIYCLSTSAVGWDMLCRLKPIYIYTFITQYGEGAVVCILSIPNEILRYLIQTHDTFSVAYIWTSCHFIKRHGTSVNLSVISRGRHDIVKFWNHFAHDIIDIAWCGWTLLETYGTSRNFTTSTDIVSKPKK